jgi:hypothetical protein
LRLELADMEAREARKARGEDVGFDLDPFLVGANGEAIREVYERFRDIDTFFVVSQIQRESAKAIDRYCLGSGERTDAGSHPNAPELGAKPLDAADPAALIDKSPAIQLIPGRDAVVFMGETVEIKHRNCYRIYAAIVQAKGEPVTGSELPTAKPGRTLKTHLPKQLEGTYESKGMSGGGFWLKREFCVT